MKLENKKEYGKSSVLNLITGLDFEWFAPDPE